MELEIARERVHTGTAKTECTGFQQEARKAAWTIYLSINNRKRYALGSPDGRELRRGEAVEILLC